MGIAELDVMVKSMPADERRLFERLFHLGVSRGTLRPPQAMAPWIERHFGSLERVSNQKIVKIINLVTFEGSLFNGLRSARPIEKRSNLDIETEIMKASPDDLLSDPLQGTPEDVFGRVEGKYCVSASNIAKYDGLHGLVIFHEPDPLRFTREQIIDYIDVGRLWAEKAHAADSLARYFFFIWNCLWRAGASLEHGHAQVMLTHDVAYAKVEALRRSALRYREEYGSNYFDDLYRVHRSLGCAFEKDGTRVISSLTPIKDREVILLADSLDLSLKERVYETLECYRDRMGVSCFNLALSTPPLGEVEESWAGFPVTARLVDRGDPGDQTSDMGSMELYASSVIASDPMETARLLKEALLPQAGPSTG